MVNVKKLQAQLKEQRKLRWFLTATSAFGLGVSAALLVVHAPHNLFAQVVGAWPPVAVFLIIEIVARVKATNRWLAIGRVAASLVVSGGGVYFSYFSQVDLIHSFGYDLPKSYVFPVLIDGFMIVSLLSMIEVTRKIRQIRDDLDAADAPAARPAVLDADYIAREQKALAYRQAHAATQGGNLFVAPHVEAPVAQRSAA